HIAVANSAALELAGIGAETADPPGGSFDRDGTGRPNGILRETAITPVSDALDPITPGPTDEQILSSLGLLPEMGIGSITG
ncbi:MAG: amidohydrolase family protein, partial [Akkermansiaceae bacterium]|nr:amidohydrolase family protein [Akkermansiaceae bacterium]NIS21835.1 amidohydrolase family protein [Thermoplasmata archaeon]NIV80586.1 amidohydrolase family protein [Thermoplasmata archaeon]